MRKNLKKFIFILLAGILLLQIMPLTVAAGGGSPDP